MFEHVLCGTFDTMHRLMDEMRRRWHSGDMTFRLIMINIWVALGLWIVQALAWVIIPDKEFVANQMRWLLEFFMVSSDEMHMLTRPWSVLTYMFLHTGFLHLLINCLYLYMFGYIFVTHLGNRRIWPVYFLGGIFGFLFYFAAGQLHAFGALPKWIFPVDGFMLGASAGVTAIMVAIGMYAPNHPVHLFGVWRVKIKWIVIVLLVLDLVSLRGGNSGGAIAHLGGALAGALFIWQLNRNADISPSINSFFDKIGGWLSKLSLVPLFKRKVERQERQKRTFEQRVKRRPVTTMTIEKSPTRKMSAKRPKPEQAAELNRQQRVDAILDKIITSGYDSLTESEKTFLKSVSGDA